TLRPIVYLPPDFVTKILSVECGISVRAVIMTFFEIPLLIRMRSPSRMVTRFSRLRRWAMAQKYHRAPCQANYFPAPFPRNGGIPVGWQTPVSLTFRPPSDSSRCQTTRVFPHDNRRSRALRSARQPQDGE